MSENNLMKQAFTHCWLPKSNKSKHCRFCNALLYESYCTSDRKTWICPACFEKYKSIYDWTVNDWRLTWQEDFLMGAKLKYIRHFKKHSERWGHEHCEFCTAKFSEYEGDLHDGYCTPDEKHWICEPCYQDFKEMFGFTPEDG